MSPGMLDGWGTMPAEIRCSGIIFLSSGHGEAAMISADVVIKAQFHDLDPMQVVWHGNYVRYLEQARCALLDRIGYNYPEMEASGFAWPVVDLRVKYVRPVRVAQEIVVGA